MPRALSSGMDSIITLGTDRRPAWAVEIFDVRSTADQINDVVTFNVTGSGSLALLTGPQDITDLIVSIQMSEQRGDYVNSGVTASTATFTLVDESGLLDPLLIVGVDPTSVTYQNLLGRYFRKGNVVTIRLGDTRIPIEEWPYIFTGEITGQAGRSRGRSTGANSSMTFKAASREARFSQFERTINFTSGTPFLTAAKDVAQTEMGLDLINEVDLSGWGTAVMGHTHVSLVEEVPTSMLAKLMFVDGFLPKFNGLGQLTQTTSTITGSPERVLANLNNLLAIDRPMSDVEQPNCVTVLGLDKNLSKIEQPIQRLATADITTGFFAANEDFEVFWSDDKTQVCENVQTRIIKSVNGGLSILGADEDFEFINAPGAGGGTIGVRITMDTGFAPWIVVFLLTVYVVLAAIPDGVSFGTTLPIGRVIQAGALSGAMFIMTKIGRGQYEWIGQPLEYVYLEIRKRACVAGHTQFERNTKTIENHLINTGADATNTARDSLFLLQAQENPRDIKMLHDLHLEPDDIFELSTGERYLIESVSYTLVRNASTALRASVKAFEVTSGVVA